ncbi:hypothetical protein SAMN04487944_10316 [Gracilibacillus ureilyticus]|uniref:Uncharacterized protein n=1 Tax=Gracilibacillus ureilyticus TaxID=531814 RepID=A0A1H9N8Y2_9BACI|nr:hypothetical protein SAMN04487944_10316 [Gracilibacillus ureilyticus]
MYRALCNTSIRIGSVPLVRLLGSFLLGEIPEKQVTQGIKVIQAREKA